jgi:hypothetical protein
MGHSVRFMVLGWQHSILAFLVLGFREVTSFQVRPCAPGYHR